MLRLGRRCFKHQTNSFTSFFKRYNSTLILGEIDQNGNLLDSTKSCISAANKISNNSINLLISNNSKQIKNINDTENDNSIDSNNIFYYNNEYRLASDVCNLLIEYNNLNKYNYIMSGLSSFSRDVLPRCAGILDVAMISDILNILQDNIFERGLYAGNVVTKIQSNDDIKIVTTRATCFPSSSIDVEYDNNTANDIISHSDINDTVSKNKLDNYEFISEVINDDESGPPLTSANIVISGGKGMQNGQNFELLRELANVIGQKECAIGASRAAVDAGYVPNDMQIGQTGKVVAPNLYVAVGISGAIQHLAGMKDSKNIVCINKDEEAPIFSVADYGLVDDLFSAVPKLTEMVKSNPKT